jgi:hypothetical protein
LVLLPSVLLAPHLSRVKSLFYLTAANVNRLSWPLQCYKPCSNRNEQRPHLLTPLCCVLSQDSRSPSSSLEPQDGRCAARINYTSYELGYDLLYYTVQEPPPRDENMRFDARGTQARAPIGATTLGPHPHHRHPAERARGPPSDEHTPHQQRLGGNLGELERRTESATSAARDSR